VTLFFIGTLCPDLAPAHRWQQKGLAITVAEAERQVHPDGVYFEQSFYYHVYALDFFLHLRVLASRNDLAVPESFDAALKKMLQVVRVLTRTGATDGFGDDDGGRIFNPRRNRIEHMADPLAVGAALFEQDSLAQAAGTTEEAIWLFGQAAVRPSEKDLEEPMASTAFADGGLYVIANSGDRTSQMLIDAGPHGIGRGGHGHADALSVRFGFNARRWLVDAGSFVYISPGDDRDQFRGTAAHNTLRVDKLDQAIPEGPFAWNSLPHVQAEHWVTGRSFTFFAGSHDGYRRLPDPVLHRRWVFHLHDKYWLLRDVAEGRAQHELEIFWHFAPELALSAASGALIAASADEKLALLSASSEPWQSAVEPGWVSLAYGEKQAATVGVFKTVARLPVEHATLLLPLHAREIHGRLQRTDAKSSEAAAYLYEQGDRKDYLICASAATDWRVGAFRSDAKLLFFCTAGLEVTVMGGCFASFVEIDGHRVFSSPAQVEWLEWDRVQGPASSDPESLKFFDQRMLRDGVPVP